MHQRPGFPPGADLVEKIDQGGPFLVVVWRAAGIRALDFEKPCNGLGGNRLASTAPVRLGRRQLGTRGRIHHEKAFRTPIKFLEVEGSETAIDPLATTLGLNVIIVDPTK
jgi:hypothetical protein